jgi:uncharacterized membrane protein YkoI
MLARNAWTVILATALAAVTAGAQQPTKPTSTPARSSTTAAQTPAAAKKGNAKTSTAAVLAVNTDSAKKIVMANVPGATITSTHLRRTSGKSYYSVNYKEKGGRKTMHATVDANTGVFTATPVTTPAAKPAAKKPS